MYFFVNVQMVIDDIVHPNSGPSLYEAKEEHRSILAVLQRRLCAWPVHVGAIRVHACTSVHMYLHTCARRLSVLLSGA